MLLHVTHETRYEYSPPVETAQHLAHLKPLATASQRLVSHRVGDRRRRPRSAASWPMLYGNTRAFFALEATHDRLVVTAHERGRDLGAACCSRRPSRASCPGRRCASASASARTRCSTRPREFVFPRPTCRATTTSPPTRAPSFAPGRPTFDVAMDLTERIYRDFDYDADSTEINTPAVEALAQRRGVCQDFAHIMIACFRTLGLPARYVSGLLRPRSRRRASRGWSVPMPRHAWVSVYLPGETADGDGGGGWADLDPTNGRQPGEDYVTLANARGRDYPDVSPMRGVLHGGAQRHTLRGGDRAAGGSNT